VLKYGFEPGKGLGVSLHGITLPICPSENLNSSGLGFKPTVKGWKKSKKRKKKTWSLPRPVPLLNESFVKSSIIKPIQEMEAELVDDFQNPFIEAIMVEVGEGTSKVDVQFIGPDIQLNNWEITHFAIKREFW